MSTSSQDSIQGPGPSSHWFAQLRTQLPTVPEVFARLLLLIVVALFLLTFVLPKAWNAHCW